MQVIVITTILDLLHKPWWNNKLNKYNQQPKDERADDIKAHSGELTFTFTMI